METVQGKSRTLVSTCSKLVCMSLSDGTLRRRAWFMVWEEMER